jgi:hypothetical protein
MFSGDDVALALRLRLCDVKWKQNQLCYLATVRPKEGPGRNLGFYSLGRKNFGLGIHAIDLHCLDLLRRNISLSIQIKIHLSSFARVL